MIILGIDPGTTRIGYGIVKKSSAQFSCVQYGILENKAENSQTRLVRSAEALDALIVEHRPDIAAIERLFFTKNQKTAIVVSEMRGVLLLTLAQRGIPVREFTPMEVKQIITGYGKADKSQIQRTIQLAFNLTQPVRPDDAADALAIALCCIVSNQ